MARPLRIQFEGAVYHVTSRGNAGSSIFLSDDDRLLFLRTLGEAVERFGWICHAYCLMPNHYHLLLETPQANLSRGMRHLNGVYTQSFNRGHECHGHLFQGRFHAELVARESHLLPLLRYTLRNPLRLGLVDDLRDWRWSSYAAAGGLEEAPAWLHLDWLLAQFPDVDRAAAHNAFRRYMTTPQEEPGVWHDLKHRLFLGDEDFIARVTSQLQTELGNLDEVPRTQRRAFGQPLHWYEEHYLYANEAMARAYLSGDWSMKEIGAHFGVHYSTVSRAVSEFEELQFR